MPLAPACYSCARYLGVLPGVGHACVAFGEDRSIPVEVLSSESDHRSPIKGDGGLTYEPRSVMMNDSAAPVRAAGILFLAPGEEVLLLRRADEGDHDGEWSMPAGKIEGDETAEEAARREAEEETGWKGKEPLVEWTRRLHDGVDFTTFLCRVGEPFEPKLNEEHDAHRWVKRSELDGGKRADALVGNDIDYVPDGMAERPRVTVRQDGTIQVW
jgi:8-oxo-dGTP pyrophosphatase MutT (NUDIX family)